MKIIILGMDNTGKSTLTEQLSNKLNMLVWTSEGPNLSKKEMENLIKMKLTTNRDYIFERFSFFDELVYGKILRNKSKFKFTDNIYKLIKESNPVIIYCRPPRQIIKNWQQREQMTGVIEKADELIKRFDKVIKIAGKQLKIIKYDYTKETVEDVISKI